jgi:hypothetical protein
LFHRRLTIGVFRKQANPQKVGLVRIICWLPPAGALSESQ